jgi:hypothetical protein
MLSERTVREFVELLPVVRQWIEDPFGEPAPQYLAPMVRALINFSG